MPKRKLEHPYVNGFHPPSGEDVKNAVGKFPYLHTTPNLHQLSQKNIFTTPVESTYCLPCVEDVDKDAYYKATELWKSLPSPMDEEAWLAKVCEEGQTFEEYTDMMTLRSGKFRSAVQADRQVIYLLPILSSSEPQWQGPNLFLLRDWASAFYCRPVFILDAATITPQPQQRDATKMLFTTPQFSQSIRGRCSAHNAHYQVHVDGLLRQMSTIKEQQGHSYNNHIIDLTDSPPAPATLHNAFAVVGVTNIDLYSGNDDLFIAGMASVTQKVAVLSFARYHPHIRMQANCWDDYGYASKSSNYSYFEENKKRPPVTVDPPALSQAAATEYLRRTGKLLVHELGHVFWINHCIYYHCLMNGTGHLVEDFSSPTHLCPVCLRKLQFRLGFSVKWRYEKLLEVFHRAGMKDEEKWMRKRLETIETE